MAVGKIPARQHHLGRVGNCDGVVVQDVQVAAITLAYPGRWSRPAATATRTWLGPGALVWTMRALACWKREGGL